MCGGYFIEERYSSFSSFFIVIFYNLSHSIHRELSYMCEQKEMEKILPILFLVGSKKGFDRKKLRSQQRL